MNSCTIGMPYASLTFATAAWSSEESLTRIMLSACAVKRGLTSQGGPLSARIRPTPSADSRTYVQGAGKAGALCRQHGQPLVHRHADGLGIRHHRDDALLQEAFLVLGEDVHLGIQRREDDVDLLEPTDLLDAPDVGFLGVGIGVVEPAGQPVPGEVGDGMLRVDETRVRQHAFEARVIHGVPAHGDHDLPRERPQRTHDRVRLDFLRIRDQKVHCRFARPG